MATRRVQVTGSETFIVSLPKSWAVRNKLARGTELRVEEERDGGIRITLPALQKKIEEAVIRLEAVPTPDALQRLIIAKYLRGYGSIRITCAKGITEAYRSVALKQPSLLAGMEVVEERQNAILLEDFLARENLSIGRLLRRAYTITAGMHVNANEALLSGDLALAGKVAEAEEEVDRLRHLITRQLNLALTSPSLLPALGLSGTDCLDVHIVAENVEELGDAAMEIALLAHRGKAASGPAADFAREVTAETYALHADAVKAFSTNNFSLADDVLGRQAKLGKTVHERETGLLAEREIPPWLTAFVGESLKIGGYGAGIAKVVIDKDVAAERARER